MFIITSWNTLTLKNGPFLFTQSNLIFFFFFPSVSSLHLYLRHHGGVFRCSLSSIFFIFIFYISLLSLCLRCHPYTLLVYSITNGLSSILYTLNTHKGTVVASLVQVCLVISFFFFFFVSLFSSECLYHLWMWLCDVLL